MITYNGRNSFIDFDLYVASKDIPVPKRKVITETVPYMNGLWDFSFHDGDVDEYEALKIKYTFDVIADTKKALSAQKAELLAWAHSRGEQKLYDSDVSDTEYYSVYQAQASWSEKDLQGLLTIEFTCYPFRKYDVTITQVLGDVQRTITIPNVGYSSVTPTFKLVKRTSSDSATATLIYGANSVNLYEGTFNDVFTFAKGTKEIQASGSGTLYIKYSVEVL